MAKIKQLHEVYRLPGIVPLPRVRGVFGDPMAVVITLKRRRKKRSAGYVARSIAAITTSGDGVCVTSPAGTSGSISSFFCAGFSARGVVV
jgi:hypothetical protein